MVKWSVEHPLSVTLLIVLATLGLGSLMPLVHVDTDPENMLSKQDPVRVFHNAMKERFAVHDMIVVGVVNEEDPDGVFNPSSLRKVYALTQFARRLQGDDMDPGQIDIDAVLAEAGLGTAPAGPGPEGPPAPAEPTAPSAEPALPQMGAGEEPALPAMGGSEEPALPAMGGQQPEAVPPPPAEAPAPSGERATRGRRTRASSSSTCWRRRWWTASTTRAGRCTSPT